MGSKNGTIRFMKVAPHSHKICSDDAPHPRTPQNQCWLMPPRTYLSASNGEQKWDTHFHPTLNFGGSGGRIGCRLDCWLRWLHELCPSSRVAANPIFASHRRFSRRACLPIEATWSEQNRMRHPLFRKRTHMVCTPCPHTNPTPQRAPTPP